MTHMNNLSPELPLLHASIRISDPSIDIEHHVLYSLLIQWLRILEKPESTPESGPESNNFIDAVIHLGDLIAMHARNEERSLAASGMPESEVIRHGAAYTRIIEQLTHLGFELIAGKRIARTELLRLIRHWISEHQREYDSKIGDNLQPSAWCCTH